MGRVPDASRVGLRMHGYCAWMSRRSPELAESTAGRRRERKRERERRKEKGEREESGKKERKKRKKIKGLGFLDFET